MDQLAGQRPGPEGGSGKPMWIVRPNQPAPDTGSDFGSFSVGGGGGGAAKPFEMYDLTEKELLRQLGESLGEKPKAAGGVFGSKKKKKK